MKRIIKEKEQASNTAKRTLQLTGNSSNTDKNVVRFSLETPKLGMFMGNINNKSEIGRKTH